MFFSPAEFNHGGGSRNWGRTYQRRTDVWCPGHRPPGGAHRICLVVHFQGQKKTGDFTDQVLFYTVSTFNIFNYRPKGKLMNRIFLIHIKLLNMLNFVDCVSP